MPSPEASRRNLKKIRHLSNGQPRRSLSESLCNNALILQGALQSKSESSQVKLAKQLGINQSHISRYSRRLFRLAMQGQMLAGYERVTLEDLARARRAREQAQLYDPYFFPLQGS